MGHGPKCMYNAVINFNNILTDRFNCVQYNCTRDPEM